MSNNKTIAIVASALAAIAVSISGFADAPPEKIELNALENLYEASVFDHEMHTGTADSCSDCHHMSKNKKPTATCTDCHSDPEKPVSEKDWSHERHFQYEACSSCHDYSSPKDLACSSCHKVPYDKENPGVIGLKAALHQQCMGCHEKNGVKNDCVVCHAKKRSTSTSR
jgi:hypothetical protein